MNPGHLLPLLIRADAGPSLGAGHVLRCLALGEAWTQRGGRATLCTRKLPAALAGQVENSDVSLLAAPSGQASLIQDAEWIAGVAKQENASWVALDGYGFGAAHRQAIRATGAHLLIVDDSVLPGPIDADILLDHNLHASAEHYSRRGSCAKLLLGPRYAMIREEFRRAKAIVEEEFPEVARRILVTLGGGDNGERLLWVLKAILQSGLNELEIRLAPGALSKEARSTLKEAGQGSRHVISPIAGGMADAMAWADLAVTGGGSTLWEAAYMGLPCVSLILAENQRAIAESLHAAGVIISPGWMGDVPLDRLSAWIREAATDPARRARMSELGQVLVDGQGPRRVVDAMYEFHGVEHVFP